MSRQSYWAEPLDDNNAALEHLGTKGMRWGVSKKPTALSRAGKMAKGMPKIMGNAAKAVGNAAKSAGNGVYNNAYNRGEQLYKKGSVQKHHTIIKAGARALGYNGGALAARTALVLTGHYNAKSDRVISAASSGAAMVNGMLASKDTVRNMSLRAYEHGIRKNNRVARKAAKNA